MCDIKRTKLFDYEILAVTSLLITRNWYAKMMETTDNFNPYLRLAIYVNILLGICIGVRGVEASTVGYQS